MSSACGTDLASTPKLKKPCALIGRWLRLERKERKTYEALKNADRAGSGRFVSRRGTRERNRHAARRWSDVIAAGRVCGWNGAGAQAPALIVICSRRTRRRSIAARAEGGA